MKTGNYVLMLHSHLPWVMNHGQWPHGEDWLTEAAAESYIPLLNVFNDLLLEGIKPKITIGLSPVLCEQLAHPDFDKKFKDYCDAKIKSASEDEEKFRKWGNNLQQVRLAKFWQQWYNDRKNNYIYNYSGSILNAFKELQDKGAIEIATCGATHGYLPLLGTEESIELQIRAAVENYKKHFGTSPRGIWLPECAYRPSYDWHTMLPIDPFDKKRLRPGIEQFLSRHGLNYFFTDQDLTDRSCKLGAFLDGNKNNYISADSPGFIPGKYLFENMHGNVFNVSSSEKTEYGTAAVFTRHHEISMQVWSGTIGYPGEPDYLDFHKKQYESYLRYWSVTDTKADMMYKQLYFPEHTEDKVDKQSNHFIHHIENTLYDYKNRSGRFGVLCTPFDTELFGHWWFEGPEFLKHLLRGIHHSPYVDAVTASERLEYNPPEEVATLPEGSWGENNNHDVWSNKANEWTWRLIYDNENRWTKMMNEFMKPEITPLMRRILTQALREMMLMHSSDWQFLIHNHSAADYAEQRLFFHNSDFNKLCDIAERVSSRLSLTREEEAYLDKTEKRDSIFSELMLEWWRKPGE